MRSWRTIVGALAFLLLVGTASAKTAETVTCTDGTTSAPGKGACSHHGGVAKGAAAAPADASGKKSTARVPLAQRAEGATAKCGDGTYWHSPVHGGACAHHQGVAQWLDTNTR